MLFTFKSECVAMVVARELVESDVRSLNIKGVLLMHRLLKMLAVQSPPILGLPLSQLTSDYIIAQIIAYKRIEGKWSKERYAHSSVCVCV